MPMNNSDRTTHMTEGGDRHLIAARGRKGAGFRLRRNLPAGRHLLLLAGLLLAQHDFVPRRAPPCPALGAH